jgi:hypothetical protein
VPKTHYVQTSFVAGVLDPRLSARTDIRQYYQGMSVGTNVVTVPLGGAKRRPGLRYVDRLRYNLSQLQAAATATAPNGGTANNARDDSTATAVTTTTDISTTNEYVVIHYDLGSAQTVLFADVIGFSLTAGESTEFYVEYSTDDTVWSIAQIPLVDTVSRNRRLQFNVSARYWRLVRIGVTDLGTAKAEVQDFLLWGELATISNVRLLPFSFNTEATYIVALTDRHGIAYEDTTAQDVLALPFESADLPEVDADQSADTMVLVHEDYHPQLIVRNVTGESWFTEEVEFTSIPDFDFNDSSSPASTDDIQAIAFANFVEGNTFQLELGGARTGPITYQGIAAQDNIDATADNIRRAVQALYTVGLEGVSVDYDVSDDVWAITFSEDSADNHPLITGTALSAGTTAAITAEKIQDGVSRREPVWSTTRGWPRTVAFHEGRLWFGGSRSLPNSYFASVVNDFFNFDLGEGLDDDAIFGTFQSQNAINALFSGRDLQLFTSGGEFRFLTSPITPSSAPKNQTKYGAKKIRPVSTDGATVFIQRTGKVLRDFLFRYEEDAYSSVPLSALASHLINAVVDMAAWQGNSDDDANYVFLVNGDGTIACYNTLRSQEVAAFTKWTTDGTFKAVGVVEEDRYVAVSRSINGTDYLYLEKMDEDYRLDAAILVNPTVSAAIGLSHLEAEECRVRDGNIVLDNITPASGAATITADGYAYEPATTIEVGLDWNPTVTTMPLNTDFGNGDNFMRKKRVVKVRANVYESLGLTLNGRELPDDYWDLSSFDEAPDVFTGVHSLEESSNWDEGTLTQTFSQTDPLPFHLLGVDLTLETT